MTKALFQYATTLAKQPQIVHLHNRSALDVVSAIKGNPNSYLFFFVHGQQNPPGVLDSFGQPIVDHTSMDLLKSRTVCGTCHSLSSLALHAIKHNATIVGYNGRMLVPLDEPYLHEMEDAAITAHRLLLSGKSAAIAAAEAGAKYMYIARKWYRGRSVKAQVLAAAAKSNGRAIGSKP